MPSLFNYKFNLSTDNTEKKILRKQSERNMSCIKIPVKLKGSHQ